MATFGELPPEVLQLVFCLLDQRSIIAVSQTCKIFSAIVSGSEAITRKLTLRLKYPEDLAGITDLMNHTTRRYRKLTIIRSRDRAVGGFQNIGAPLFARLGTTIRDLKIDWTNALRPREASLFEIMNRRRRTLAQAAALRVPEGIFDDHEAAQGLALVSADIYNEFMSVIGHFSQIESLTMCNVHLERGGVAQNQQFQYLQLRRVTLKQCDAFCFDLLSACTLLTNITVIEPWWNNRGGGITQFETFLTHQRHLRDLQLIDIQYPRLFLTDRSAEMRFRVDNFVMRNSFFADYRHAVSFFQNQPHIRSIEFQLQNERARMLDEILFYNNILRTIVTSIPELETVNIAKLRYNLPDLDFIADVRNYKVKSLIFRVTAEDNSSQLFKTLVRMFPSLRSISFKAEESEDTDSGVCFDKNTVLHSVKSLSIVNSSVNSLVNVHAMCLTRFEYAPGKTGEFIDHQFGAFFHRHRNIKHLVIGSSTGRSYFFVSFNLCEIICNFLTQLESITIYNFAEVNKSVKILCNLTQLKSLTLSTDDFQKFTAKTKVECGRKCIKLISVDIASLAPTPSSFLL